MAAHIWFHNYLYKDAFYQSSPWLEPSVESLLESPVAELSVFYIKL